MLRLCVAPPRSVTSFSASIYTRMVNRERKNSFHVTFQLGDRLSGRDLSAERSPPPPPPNRHHLNRPWWPSDILLSYTVASWFQLTNSRCHQPPKKWFGKKKNISEFDGFAGYVFLIDTQSRWAFITATARRSLSEIDRMWVFIFCFLYPLAR